MLDDAQLKETYVSGERLYTGAILNLERWQVKLPSGETAPREIVLHQGAAGIVPVDDQGRVILVRQYRTAIEDFTWEIPAGKLDKPGEDTLECAKRELGEETGCTAARWQLLTRMVASPGFTNERIALYLATALQSGNEHPDQDEFITAKAFPLAEAVAMVERGDLRDAKTCLALLLAEKALKGRRA